MSSRSRSKQEQEEGKSEVTSGKEWRQRRVEGWLETLPSGNVARLRTVSLLDFVNRGEIPDPLSAAVAEMLGGKSKDIGDFENFKQFAGLAAFVCRQAFVLPRIVDDPKADDEVSILDIDFADQRYVFNIVQKEILMLAPFRQE